MPYPVNVPLARTRLDRCSIELEIADSRVIGQTAQLRLAGLGTLTGTVNADGVAAFDPDDDANVRSAAVGSYVYALILDPSGPERRTYAAGYLTIADEPTA